ncbi:hypothetical protein Q2T76_01665 [Lactobacillus sp. YT155]|uniref:hypothetical protein n=1 Tax=Lactobacillus sp. YT155 TaxID=3060955 RepID=UPI00265E431D|nr:hypothetical protein [Lactobacillus sp. YT155]MDO1604759.1 hypothetical protein [Lactobacillus sp. YT155]
MNKLNKLFDDISLEEAFDKIKQTDIYQDINGTENHLVSFAIKKAIVLILSLIVPMIFLAMVTQVNYAELPPETQPFFIIVVIFVIMVISINLFIYFGFNRKYKNQYLNNFRYRLIVYLLIQFNVIMYGNLYILMLFDGANAYLYLTISFGYWIIELVTVYLVIKGLIKESINNIFERHLPVSKWVNRVYGLVALTAVLIFAGMYMYRVNKAIFIMNGIDDPSQLLNGISHIVISLAIMIIVLLPILIFNADIYVRAKILDKYSEEFREDNGYSVEEWYWEDYGR